MASTYWITLRAGDATLEEPVRSRILNDIVDLCLQRDWRLAAAHVKRDCVQTVITANEPAPRVNRALQNTVSRHRRDWQAESPRALRRDEKESAIRETVGRDLMALFVAGS